MLADGARASVRLETIVLEDCVFGNLSGECQFQRWRDDPAENRGTSFEGAMELPDITAWSGSKYASALACHDGRRNGYSRIKKALSCSALGANSYCSMLLHRTSCADLRWFVPEVQIVSL